MSGPKESILTKAMKVRATKLKLNKSEQRILDWIIEEWDSEWNTEKEITVEGEIHFKPNKLALITLVSKKVIYPRTEYFVATGGIPCFHCVFNPIEVLKYYNGYDFTELVDPNQSKLFLFD
jgi:hypothetical protein